ncbi:hypothetical protein ABE527_02595 [Brucella sp. TWI432]
MKVVASTNDGFLVEMTDDEIAKAAGYGSTYADAWEKANGNSRKPLVGAVFDVRAAYDYHVRVKDNAEKCRSSAGLLRGLADMLETGMPEVITLPEPIVSKKADEVQS